MRRFLSFLIGLVSLLLLGSGIIVAIQQSDHVARLMPDEATVLPLTGKGRLALAQGAGPVVQLILPSGETADVPLEVGLAESLGYRLPQIVPVLYDPADPTVALLDHPLAIWAEAVATGGFGLLLLLLAVLIAPRRRVVGGQASRRGAAGAPPTHAARPIVVGRSMTQTQAVVRGGERSMPVQVILTIILLILAGAAAGFYLTGSGAGPSTIP